MTIDTLRIAKIAGLQAGLALALLGGGILSCDHEVPPAAVEEEATIAAEPKAAPSAVDEKAASSPDSMAQRSPQPKGDRASTPHLTITHHATGAAASLERRSLTGTTTPAPARPKTPTEQPCLAKAYVTDAEGEIALHHGPGPEFSTVGMLPEAPVEVVILGQEAGWLRISGAARSPGHALTETGWVEAPTLRLKTRDSEATVGQVPLYTAADRTSAIAATLPQDTEVTLVGCQAEWLQVQTDGTTGWLAFEHQCSNPNGTCR
ncbi:MAG: SH3 domain-containing protein [Leptolyngbyaceae cyanobacterium T60_A2020_046]|nr:SH3 domain-containing protein [Leptolyngbyaceae cyanobacterium T60_A2020_046]